MLIILFYIAIGKVSHVNPVLIYNFFHTIGLIPDAHKNQQCGLYTYIKYSIIKYIYMTAIKKVYYVILKL